MNSIKLLGLLCCFFVSMFYCRQVFAETENNAELVYGRVTFYQRPSHKVLVGKMDTPNVEFTFVSPETNVYQFRLEFNNKVISGMIDKLRENAGFSLKDSSDELTEYLQSDKDDLRVFYEYLFEQLVKFFKDEGKPGIPTKGVFDGFFRLFNLLGSWPTGELIQFPPENS